MKLDFFNRKIGSWLEGGYLCRDRIIQWLQGIVDRVLQTVNWPWNITVRIVSLHYNNPLTFIHFWNLCLLMYWEAFPKVKVPRAQSLLLSLMFIGPCIIVIVEEYKTSLMSLAILFHFLCVQQASACNTDTTPTQPHRNSNTH